LEFRRLLFRSGIGGRFGLEYADWRAFSVSFYCRNGTSPLRHLARNRPFSSLKYGSLSRKRTWRFRSTLVKVPLDQWVTKPSATCVYSSRTVGSVRLRREVRLGGGQWEPGTRQ